MKKNKLTPIVSALILSFLALTVIVLPGQIKNSQNLNSKADIINLIPPYIRLSSTQANYNVGDFVPVDIYVNTGNLQTFESRFVIKYDNSLLSLDESNIKNKGIYPVMNVESNKLGEAIFSVFTKDEAGYGPIVLQKEKNVATLNFKALQKGSANITLLTSDDKNNSSSISFKRVSPDQPAANILNSVQSIVLEIN